MNGQLKSLIAKYRNNGILVDTNILLLYVVGLTNQQRIPLFKRTNRFIAKDFDTLRQLLRQFPTVVTTPSILTEVSNLSGQLNEPERSTCMGLFADEIQEIEEYYIPSRETAKDGKFQRFGLTDCGIAQISLSQYLVLTDDLPLSAYLSNQGIDTLNFNNIRKFGWSS